MCRSVYLARSAVMPTMSVRHSPRHMIVSENLTRSFVLQCAARMDGGDLGADVVVVHALRVTAVGFPLSGQWLLAQHLRRWAVGLLVILVDHGEQVVERLV